MKKMLKSLRIVLSWGGALIFAWVTARYIVWNALELLFGYQDTKKALAGMLFFILVSVISSFYRDYRNDLRAHDMATDKMDAGSQNWIMNVIVFGLRAAMAGYVCQYWFSEAVEWSYRSDPIFVQDLFPALLALGILTALNFGMVGYGLILEPWRILMRELPILGAGPNPKQSAFGHLFLRLTWLIIYNLILFWFFIPPLASKLPSTGLLVVITMFLWGFSRKGRNR